MGAPHRPTIRLALTVRPLSLHSSKHLFIQLYLFLLIVLPVLNSCYRHDFGYRNFKKQNRFSEANKARIDSNFKTDMFNQCKSEDFQDACEATATVYYEAVKAFGKKRAVEILEARRARGEKVGSVE